MRDVIKLRVLRCAKPYSSKWSGEKGTPINSISIGEKRGTNLGKCSFTFTSAHFLISKCKTYFRAFQQFPPFLSFYFLPLPSPTSQGTRGGAALAHRRNLFSKLYFVAGKQNGAQGCFSIIITNDCKLLSKGMHGGVVRYVGAWLVSLNT